jgi:protein-disulfide isomerase
MYQPQWHPPPKQGLGAGAIVAIVLGIGLLLFVMLGAAGAVFYMRMRAASSRVSPHVITTPIATTPSWSDSDSPVPVTSDDPMRGDRNALVTIVTFEDFQDPFCARLETTFDTIRTTYSSSDLRFIWKNEPLPFHPQARAAAEAGEGVFELGGSTAFWTFHDRAFASGTYSLAASNYDVWAGEAGVSSTKLEDGIAKGSYASKVDEDDKLAKTLGAVGTPTSFINGRLVSGAQPLTAFTKIIDDELFKARRRVSAGAPLDRIYVTLSKENFAPAPSYGFTPPPVPTVTGGGTTITDTVAGSGRAAVKGDKLVVHYVGTLDDGSTFDSSRSRSTPFEFELGRGMVIKGWENGLAGMRVGGKRTIVIPPNEAYGSSGVPPKIPPNATLHFDVELLAIK